MADEHLPVGQEGNAKILAEISSGHVAETINLTTAIGAGAMMLDVWGTSTGTAIVTDTSGTMQQYARGAVRTLGASTDAAVVTDTSGTVAAYLRALVVALTSGADMVDAGAVGVLSAKVRRLTQDLGRIFVDHSRHEFIEHPFARGSLTTDGVQYGTATTASVGSSWAAVETVTIDPPYGGAIVELEFGLTASMGGSTVAYLRNHKWQAASVGSTWVDLCSAFVSSGAGSTSYVEQTHSGYFSTGNANLGTLPMQLRLVIYSSGATGETVTGRTKNSSYVRYVVEST